MIKFINKNEEMLNKITTRLDKDHIDDYDVMEEIPLNSISLGIDLANLEIYIPNRFEYSQFEIDDKIRSLAFGVRTYTTKERDYYKMEVLGKLNFEQYIKLIKFIIDTEDGCVIVNNNE